MQSSDPPSSSVALFTNSSIFSCSEISNLSILMLSNFFFSSSSFSTLVPVAKILAPLSCSLSTIELPIPPDAPVTIIFLFFKLLVDIN